MPRRASTAGAGGEKEKSSQSNNKAAKGRGGKKGKTASPKKKSATPRRSPKKKRGGAKSVPYYVCQHVGCGMVALDPRQMAGHERRFQLHADHVAECGDQCPRCQDLFAAGEWTAEGGRDDCVCRHAHCEYFSSSPRIANRRQAVERHEAAFPIHHMHFADHGQTCALCQHMVAGEWSSQRALWSNNHAQLVRRLASKEAQNRACLTALPPLPDGKHYVRHEVLINFSTGPKARKGISSVEVPGPPPAVVGSARKVAVVAVKATGSPSPSPPPPPHAHHPQPSASPPLRNSPPPLPPTGYSLDLDLDLELDVSAELAGMAGVEPSKDAHPQTPVRALATAGSRAAAATPNTLGVATVMASLLPPHPPPHSAKARNIRRRIIQRKSRSSASLPRAPPPAIARSSSMYAKPSRLRTTEARELAAVAGVRHDSDEYYEYYEYFYEVGGAAAVAGGHDAGPATAAASAAAAPPRAARPHFAPPGGPLMGPSARTAFSPAASSTALTASVSANLEASPLKAPATAASASRLSTVASPAPGAALHELVDLELVPHSVPVSALPPAPSESPKQPGRFTPTASLLAKTFAAGSERQAAGFVADSQAAFRPFHADHGETGEDLFPELEEAGSRPASRAAATAATPRLPAAASPTRKRRRAPSFTALSAGVKAARARISQASPSLTRQPSDEDDEVVGILDDSSGLALALFEPSPYAASRSRPASVAALPLLAHHRPPLYRSHSAIAHASPSSPLVAPHNIFADSLMYTSSGRSSPFDHPL